MLRPRREVATALLIISVLEATRAFSQRPAQRLISQHPAAALRSQACEEPLGDGLLITRFMLRYGNMAGAGTSVEVDIRMCLSCGGISKGESITLKLPGFSRRNVGSLSDAMFAQPLATEGINAEFFNSAIWHEGTSTLKFLCSEQTRNGKRYIFNVPLRSGLTLPANGVRLPSVPPAPDDISYYTDSCNGGPREPQPLSESDFEPVGFFVKSSIDFSPRAAGETSQISISLTPAMLIQSQELISVALPRFRCQAKSPCDLKSFQSELRLLSNTTATFTAQSEWIDSNNLDGGDVTGTLSMRLDHPVNAGDTAVIIISKGTGLNISTLGVNVNDQTLTGM